MMATKDLRAKPPEMPVKCLEGNTMGTLQTDLLYTASCGAGLMRRERGVIKDPRSLSYDTDL
jgi:hypothetical protein